MRRQRGVDAAVLAARAGKLPLRWNLPLHRGRRSVGSLGHAPTLVPLPRALAINEQFLSRPSSPGDDESGCLPAGKCLVTPQPELPRG